jgi:type IV secretory pathway VirB10-like protein
MRMNRLSFVIVWLLAVATVVSAQSLADLARKEEARRKQVKKPSRLITNKDLRAIDARPPQTAETAQTPPAKPADEAAPADKTEKPDAPDPAAKDEQAWRQRMADAKLALERSQMYQDALQSKINSLWADFTARDDPAQRAQIELERKRAIAEQERVKGEIEVQKKAIADLEEEARRAGVPPGWLR